MEYRACSASPYRNGWRVDMRPVMEDGSLGERVRKNVKASSKSDAIAIAEKRWAAGFPRHECGDMTVAKAIERYLESPPGTVNETTLRGYRQVAARIDGKLASTKILICDDSHIRNYLRRRGRAGAAANSIRAEYSLINVALKKCVRDGFAVRNPADAVRPPEKELHRGNNDLRDKVRHLLLNLEGDIALAGLIAIEVDALPCQIVALRWQDLSRSGALTIRCRISRKGELTEYARAQKRILSREVHSAALREKERKEATESDFIIGSGRKAKSPDLLSKDFSSLSRAFGLGCSLSGLRR